MKGPLKVHKLTCHETKEGVMYPIYNDWQFPNHKIGMAYITTINPLCTKGPILHFKRSGFMTGISGDMVIETRKQESSKIISCQIEDIFTDQSKNIIEIPAGIPVKITNRSYREIGVLVNLPDVAWKPEDEDTFKFKDWRECFEFLQKQT